MKRETRTRLVYSWPVTRRFKVSARMHKSRVPAEEKKTIIGALKKLINYFVLFACKIILKSNLFFWSCHILLISTLKVQVRTPALQEEESQ